MGETRVRTTGRKSTWANRVSAGHCRSMGLAGSSRADLPLSTLAKVVVPLPIVTGHCTHRENLSGFPMSASSPADHTISENISGMCTQIEPLVQQSQTILH